MEAGAWRFSSVASCEAPVERTGLGKIGIGRFPNTAIIEDIPEC